MSFLMMAAHDTLTSSLTSFVGALAANPQWQRQAARRSHGAGVAAGEPTSFDQSGSNAAVGDGVQGSDAA